MGTATLTDSTSLEFERQLAALAYLHRLDPDMNVLAVRVLLTISAQPGLTVGEIAEKLEAFSSTVSRVVARLGKRGGQGNNAGLHLIEMEEKAEDARQKMITLTPKGRKVMDRIQELLAA
jgi:DNA-binding MarR family transcriptional regulator